MPAVIGWPDSDLENLDGCPACAVDDSTIEYSQLSDRFFSTGSSGWTLWKCNNCSVLFLNPRPTTNSIGRAYESYITDLDPLELHVADNGASYAWRLVNGYLNFSHGMTRTPTAAIGRFIVPLLPGLKRRLDYFARDLGPGNGKSLLDVGCGNGLFLLRAKSAGWNVEGVDFDASAVQRARASGLNVREMPLEEISGENVEKYAAVTLSHVIEHVHRPSGILDYCFKQLAPGGMIWIATPNQSSFGHLVFREKWIGLDSPRHLTIF